MRLPCRELEFPAQKKYFPAQKIGEYRAEEINFRTWRFSSVSLSLQISHFQAFS
jgi:hypothetical protein